MKKKIMKNLIWRKIKLIFRRTNQSWDEKQSENNYIVKYYNNFSLSQFSTIPPAIASLFLLVLLITVYLWHPCIDFIQPWNSSISLISISFILSLCRQRSAHRNATPIIHLLLIRFLHIPFLPCKTRRNKCYCYFREIIFFIFSRIFQPDGTVAEAKPYYYFVNVMESERKMIKSWVNESSKDPGACWVDGWIVYRIFIIYLGKISESWQRKEGNEEKMVHWIGDRWKRMI